MTRSITLKLILAFLLVSVTVVALASGITYWLTVGEFKQLVFNQSRDRFVADAALYYQINGTWNGVLDYFDLRNVSPQPGGGPGPSPDQPSFGPGNGQGHSPAFAFLLADSAGKVLVPAGTYQAGDLVPQARLAQGTAVEVNGKRVGTVLVLGNPPPLGTLETQYLNRTNMALLYAALGAALVALLLGIILARTLTHPLRDLTAAIHAMAKGDLKQHVVVNTQDEIGELAAAFNQMSADLDRLNRSRRQMTADIAHDLRSPLTVIGGYVESMRDGVLKPTPERLDTIHAEVDHLQRLVEDLRTLSQADAGELSLNREAVDPLALLEQIAKSYGHLAGQKKVALEVQADSGLPKVRIDPDRMAQVFGNLVTNSLRYTPEDGRIVLSAGQEAGSLVFTVRDTGQGIPAEALPHIFDRFYRADPARSQGSESGLGLAIARSIVEAHGGSISAESEVGKGTTIRIAFPVQ
ncbi:MAG TPA: HAMP domain-containing sensor histidine kinase [Anaerolineales bacterium]|nr:HAMP domain-containing sensor histidine kinase [Anaerolineales bacterium]